MSLFSGFGTTSNQGQNTNTGGGLFGSTNAQPQQQQQQQQQQPSLFGNPQTQNTNQPTTSLFGGPAPLQSQPTQPSLFGGATTGGGTTANTGGGLFGSTNTNATTGTSGGGGLFGGGAFGNQQQQQQQPTTGGGLFGSTTTQQQQPTISGGLFGNAAQNPAGQQTTGGGLFGSTTQQQQPAAGTGLFGSTSQQQGTAGGGLFGSTLGQQGQQQQQQPSGGLFGGGATQQQQPTATGGLFGGGQQQQPTAGGGLFGSRPGLFGSTSGTTGTSSLFGGQQQQQQQPQQQQQQQPSLFGTQSTSNGGSLFGNKSTLGTSTFGQPATGLGSSTLGASSLLASRSGTSSAQQLSEGQSQFVKLTERIEIIYNAWNAGSPHCRFQHPFYNLVDPNQVSLYGRPPNVLNDSVWEKAVRENPDPTCFVPVVAIGFDDLRQRVEAQSKQADDHQQRLKEVKTRLEALSTRHSVSNLSRLQRASAQQTQITHRLLKFVQHLHLLIPAIRSSAIRPEEEQLRSKLEEIEDELRKGRIKAKLNELWALLGAVNASIERGRAGGNGDWAVVDEEGMSQIVQVLKDQQTGLGHLTKILQKHQKDIAVVMGQANNEELQLTEGENLWNSTASTLRASALR